MYADGLITKVLGTSFFVKSKEYASEVIVKTGKVAVFLHNDRDRQNKINSNELDGLILNENESININQDEYKLNKPLLVSKDDLKLPIQKLSFNFDEASAIDVLKTINKAYNDPIVFDTARLANCKLTAHLSDEPLLQKVELICIALEASYIEVDNKIVIKSNGCK